MKFHKPLFSFLIILIQLILSVVSYIDFVAWEKGNPEFVEHINRIFHEDSLFLFVLIIGFYEMQTKPSWFKTAIRIFLVCIILGTQFSGLVPIAQFYFGVYNTAWFSTVVVVVLILTRIGKYSIGKINNKNLNKASR
jgi:VIT1/CCC1 family predicted Fe2+/Mn2+ transporter